MNKTKIEWCDLTWNPITGCKRGCSYCYARRIHERFNKTPFSDIIIHPYRFEDPDLWNKPPSRIFVGSMSDIEYWDKRTTEWLLDVCRTYHKHTFMFLSKSAKSYRGYNWPSNTMQGLTLEKCVTVLDNYQITLLAGSALRPFLSIEPLLGHVHFNLSFKLMETIIVGAMTGPGAQKPQPSWVRSVSDCIPAEKVFWKKSILPYVAEVSEP